MIKEYYLVRVDRASSVSKAELASYIRDVLRTRTYVRSLGKTTVKPYIPPQPTVRSSGEKYLLRCLFRTARAIGYQGRLRTYRDVREFIKYLERGQLLLRHAAGNYDWDSKTVIRQPIETVLSEAKANENP